MRKRFIVLTTLLPIAAACATSGVRGQASVPSAHVPVLQDTALTGSLHKAQEVLANLQRVLQDSTTLAAANQALENAAALSALVWNHLAAQQTALERMLQQSDTQLHTIFQQLEHVQRRVDEIMREQRK